MTMFEELFALASGATLTMTLSADAATGRLTVNVIPKPKSDLHEPALAQALSLTATPQEFDAGFVAALRGYRSVRQSLAEQAEATQEVLAAATAASVRQARDATAKASAKPAAPLRARATAPAMPPPADVAATTADGEEGMPAPSAPGPTAGASFDLFG